MAGLNTAQIIEQAKNMGISLSDSQAQPILSQAWDQKQYGADAGKVSSILGGMKPAASSSTSNPTQTYNAPDPAVAQATYQKGIDSAVSSLQTQGTNLDSQYSDLLGKVMGVGTVAMNTATTGENNLLASRGIVNNSPLYSSQMTSAQLPVTTAVQGQIGSLGYTQAQLKNELANNIASIQAGGAGTLAGLPLSYGSLALASAANLANIGLAGSQASQAGASARYIPIPNVGLYDVQGGSFVGGVTNNNLNTGGYQILNVK